MPGGIGWFRGYVRFMADSVPISFLITSYALFAAEELYLDGNLMYSFGLPSPLSEKEVIGQVSLFPTFVPVVLMTSTTHTIALRVSTWERKRTKYWFFWFQRLIKSLDIPVTYIVEPTSGLKEYKQMQRGIIHGISTGILVLMFMYLVYLALLDRNDMLARHLSLFVLFSLFLSASWTVQYYLFLIPQSQYFIVLLEMTGMIGYSFRGFFLVLAVASFYHKPLIWWHKNFALLCVGTSFFLSYVLNEKWSVVAGEVFLVLLYAELLCIVMWNVIQTKSEKNSWIFAAGVIFVSCTNILEEIRSISNTTTLLNVGVVLLTYNAVPVVFAFILVRRTAQDRIRLARYSHDLEEQVKERTRELQSANEEISRQMEVQAEQARDIEKAHHESETLLLNILPAPIAHRLKSGERAIADKFDSVTVLFADIVGFTKLSARTTPEELVQGLNAIFERFDALAKKYGLEKIKTIGDAYMVAGGLPERSDDHCERVGMFALEIQAIMQEESLRTSAGECVQLRIGIHTGEAVAGVIGTSKFSYDLWGDTVNTASRMESHGEAGRIHVSEDVYDTLKDTFTFEKRGEIEVKGKGLMRTWFLVKAKY